MRIEGEEVKITGKQKVRSDKKPKIQAYVTVDVHNKINRLARTCDVSESQIAAEMLTYLFNHPDYVSWLQMKFGVGQDDPFRIVPIKDNGQVIYYALLKFFC
jgi:hypothetical protein